MTTATLTEAEASVQSLASGTAGAALLAVERALTGTGSWDTARAAIAEAAAGPVDAGKHTGLFYGAPALAFTLHAARADGRPRYETAAAALAGHAARITERRLADARDRMKGEGRGKFGEYDLFYGLTGLGVVLLRTAPGSDALEGVLRYLTELARPVTDDGAELPGWWAGHDPDALLPTPGGHANLGMAHGAAGILAFAALAALAGVTVDGQRDMIEYLQSWFGRWRQDGNHGPWWPEWLTRADLRAGRPARHVPGRTSWCYGTPGIARALQLAAIATGDTARQHAAEDALAACLPVSRLSRITEPGLCHGLAGIYQTAVRASADALTPAITRLLPDLAALLQQHAAGATRHGLLTGTAGVRLALETARTGTTPRSGWDSCLLLA